jgi:squalene-hopene/tetraprenyl-beta-curcumene cyclase
MGSTLWSALLSLIVGLTLALPIHGDEPVPQYQFEGISVPAARPDEPLAALSVEQAVKHLDAGALAWTGQRGCVTCHTNGSYMVLRPALTPQLGKPVASLRQFFVRTLHKFAGTSVDDLQAGTTPAQVIYTAAGLAEWDAHVEHALSAETDAALRLMFKLQRENGTWGSLDCWPPFESSAYHLATVAAMAAATAPGWLHAASDDAALSAGMTRLREYLQRTSPANDYERLLLLWASTRMPDLIDGPHEQELIDLVWSLQREDGGWSIRSFSTPEQWGAGNRAAKLHAEPEFENPPSDGHQTGLAVLVLRDAGVPADDPRLQRAIAWLKSNQRESGRWWTRSLNTDKWHFITYSGTAYALLALAKCDALPPSDQAATAE